MLWSSSKIDFALFLLDMKCEVPKYLEFKAIFAITLLIT